MQQHRDRLLLVDGDIERAQRLARRLSALEFDIQIADNGATALLKAHAVRPAAVVAAADLPILDGHLMLQALRSEESTSRVPVIILTNGDDQEEFKRAWTAGADLCIPRSQGEADVVATLHRALQEIPSRRTIAGEGALRPAFI